MNQILGIAFILIAVAVLLVDACRDLGDPSR